MREQHFHAWMRLPGLHNCNFTFIFKRLRRVLGLLACLLLISLLRSILLYSKCGVCFSIFLKETQCKVISKY